VAENDPRGGAITALTWALEVGDTSRFRTIKQAVSYCGLCRDEKSSADKVMRTPISKAYEFQLIELMPLSRDLDH